MRIRCAVIYGISFALGALLSATAVLAGHYDPALFERRLLPLAVARPVAGVNGSLWEVQAWVLNASGETVDLVVEECRGILAPCVEEDRFEAGESRQLRPLFFATPTNPSVFVYVPRSRARDIWINAHVFDSAVAEQNRGTELPIVHETEFRDSSIHLLQITVSEKFRAMLRIYEFDERAAAEFTVNIIGMNSHRLLQTFHVQTKGLPGDLALHRFPRQAGFFQLPFYGPFGDGEAVRIEVIPVTRGIRFWAFVSITNNETHHVTLVTPQ